MNIVAPYTGAWIETPKIHHYMAINDVAPYTGAWIETGSYQYTKDQAHGRTLHGCVD